MSEKLCTSSVSSNSSDSEESCSAIKLSEKTAACERGTESPVDGATGGVSTAEQRGRNTVNSAGLAEGLDRFLAQQRCDLMTELRKLQHAQRPVTNTDSRETLEEFFTNAAQPDGAPARPANRPESVRSEVQGLAERRPVTSVLSTQSFRRSLEGVIRGTLVRQDRELQQALRLQAAGFGPARAAPAAAQPAASTADTFQQHMESLSQLSHSSSSSHTGLADLFSSPHGPPQAPPLPPPGPPMMPPQSQPSWQRNPYQPQPWQQQPWQQQQQPWQQQQQPQQQQPWQQQPWQQQQQPWQQQPWQQQQQPWQQQMQQPPVLPQQPWLTQNRGTQEQANGGVNMLAYLQHVQREDTVFEISDLIQRQVVSSALNSNFRDTLENTMLGRLQSMDTDGLRVQNFIQSLQQSTQHQRNDFSHLGISAPTPGQQSAEARGLAASQQIPSGPEMERMRQQMEEMRTMLRLTFELQMDMQRSIRQEVAAALSGRAQTGTPDVSTATPPPPVSQPASEGQCIICLERSVDAVLYQCGHMCCCLSCGLRLRGMGAHCPMCRAPIRDVIRAYRCQRD